MPDLGSTISLNASNFAAGIAQTRAKLVELNTALVENRQKMKELNKEALELQKQEKALTDSMKDGGTKEQQQELEQLRVRIGQVNSELGTLKTRERELQSDIRKTSGELDNQKNSTNELTTSTDKANDALKKLETGLKAIIAGAAGKKLYDVLIGSNAEMEQYLTSFEVMLGDAEKAKTLMSELNTMAAKTPMGLDDVTSVGTLLMNYGVQADKLIDIMTQLGDLAAGNAQKFERVSLAYGQMLAKGKVSGEELRQMTEAGVPLLQALADELGVTAGEMQEMVSKGKIGIPELNAAIASITTGTGQFAGMMEKQAETFSGMLSTLSDEATQFGREVGEEAFGVAKESLSDLLDLIDEWRDDGTLDTIAHDLGVTVKVAAESIKTLITLLVECRGAVIPLISAFVAYKGTIKGLSIIDGFKASVATLTSYLQGETVAAANATVAQEGLNAAMAANPIALLIAGVAGLTVGFVMLMNELSSRPEKAQKHIAELADEVHRLSEESKNSVEEQRKLQGVIDEYDRIHDTVTDVKEQKEQLAQLQETLNGLYDEEKGKIDLVNGSYDEQIEKLKELNREESLRKQAEVSEAIKKADEAIREASAHQLPITFDWKGANEEFEENLNKLYKRLDSDRNTKGLVTLSGGKSDERNLLISGSVGEQIEALKLLKKTMEDSGATNGDYASSYLEICNKIDMLSKLLDDKSGLVREFNELEKGVNGIVDVSDSLGDAAASAERFKKELEDSAKASEQFDELSKSASDLESKYSSLYDATEKLQNGESLSYDQIKELIKIYPDLAKHIKVTADGYSVETNALGDLRDALEDSVTANAEAQRQMTADLIEGSKNRIRVWQAEMQSYAKAGDFSAARERQKAIAEEFAQLAEMEAQLELTGTIPKTVQSGSGKKSGTSSKISSTPGSGSIAGYMKTASAAVKEFNDNGELAQATVQALISAGHGELAVYDELNDKWTVTEGSLKSFNDALEAQIAAAQGVDGATKTEIDYLESLRKKLKEVENGTYGVEEATKQLTFSTVDSSMSTLSKAVAEQKNGKLSAKTLSALSNTEYSSALITMDGKLQLDTDKVSEMLGADIEKAITKLNGELEKTTDEDKKIKIQAKIQALEDLSSQINDVTAGTYGDDKTILSEKAFKDFESEQKKKLKLIDDELKAKQKLRDETLKAIDEEVQARKRLTEDNDIQHQIDQVMAQLKYSQLDEFSRAQLGRKLQSLQNDKADMLWERGVEDRKAAANEAYDTEEERLNAEKESINNAISVLNTLNDTVSAGTDKIAEQIKEALESVKPGSTVNVQFNKADGLSESQIIKLVEDLFGVTATT